MENRKLKVRKGLETPLLVKGLLHNDFYLLLLILAALVLYSVISLVVVVTSPVLTFRGWLLQPAICLVIFISVHGYLKKKAKKKTGRMKFDKVESTLSNRDLIQYL